MDWWTVRRALLGPEEEPRYGRPYSRRFPRIDSDGSIGTPGLPQPLTRSLDCALPRLGFRGRFSRRLHRCQKDECTAVSMAISTDRAPASRPYEQKSTSMLAAAKGRHSWPRLSPIAEVGPDHDPCTGGRERPSMLIDQRESLRARQTRAVGCDSERYGICGVSATDHVECGAWR